MTESISIQFNDENQNEFFHELIDFVEKTELSEKEVMEVMFTWSMSWVEVNAHPISVLTLLQKIKLEIGEEQEAPDVMEMPIVKH